MNNEGILNDLVEKKIILYKGGYILKIDNRTLEVIKVLSLVVIAISSAFIALWLSQISQTQSGIVNNLSNLSEISKSLFDLSNKE